MLCPLELEEPLTGCMNKQEPLELHWRKHPPSCRGGIEKAYYRAYPDLVQEVLCFQCGAIPCPYKHDDSDKKQRLADMEFIKELALERREMKEEITKLNHKVAKFEKQEEEWNRTQTLLEAEIKRLLLLNEQNRDFMNEMRKEQQAMKLLKEKLEALEEENQRLKNENETYKKRIMNQTGEINDLMRQNDVLSKELDTSKGNTKKLMIQVDESKKAVLRMTKQLAERDAKIADMEKQLNNLVAELTEKTAVFKQKELEFETLVKELKDLINNLKKAKSDTEARNKDLLKMIAQLQEEIEMLKKKLASDTRFRQFVEIKRECNVLKDVSGSLAQKVQDYENAKPLPAVKKSGKVSKRSKAYGPGSRPKTSLLDRPKSAKIPVRPTDLNSSEGGGGGELANLNDFDDESRPPSSQFFSRPKSARSPQFRSPTAVSCGDDAEIYVFNDDVSRPGSGLQRTQSARYTRRSPMYRDSESPNWSRGPSRLSTDSPVFKRNAESSSLETPYKHSAGYINEDNLNFTSEDLKTQNGSRLPCTPTGSVDGSDINDFEFEPLGDLE